MPVPNLGGVSATPFVQINSSGQVVTPDGAAETAASLPSLEGVQATVLVQVDKDGDIVAPGGAAEYSGNLEVGGDLLVTGEAEVTGTVTAEKFSSTSPEYAGTGSHQAVEADLNLEAAAGSTGGRFLAAVMGNLIGVGLTKLGNYLAGVIGHYTVTGVKATTYPAGAVLAGIGDGVTEADGAVVAYIDGDSEVTTAEAAFKVMHNNSTPGSGFQYGVDLYDEERDGFDQPNYFKAPLRLDHEVCILTGDGVPVDGTTGDNFAGPGSLYIDFTNGNAYLQTSLVTTPVWKLITRAG